MRAAARRHAGGVLWRLGLIAAVTLLVQVLLVLSGSATPASAHPTLLGTTPEAGYSVASAPDRVTLVFDEPVTVDPRGVRVLDDHGEPVRTSDVVSEQGGRRLAVRLLDDLDDRAAGRYVVRWQVTAQDGDVVSSGFDFAVATGSARLRGQEETGTTGFGLVMVLRWLLFVGLAGVLGGRAGERLAARSARSATVPRSLVRPSALLGLLAVTGLLIHLLITTGTGGRAAFLLGVEAAGLAAAVAVASRGRWWSVLPPALLVVAAEAVRSHLGTQRGAVGALILAVHLLAGATWIGALIHVLRAVRVNRGTRRLLLAAYARLALGLFLAVLASGTIGALLLVPSLRDLGGTAYGRVLIAKLTLVAAAAALAWTGRRRLAHTATPTAPTGSVAPATQIEAVTLVCVLAVSAALVSLPTPAPATRGLGLPPPPVAGPVVRLGTLAGQVAVGIAASENQLEIRLRVPDDRVQIDEARPPDFRVAARVSGSGARSATVPLRACGPGCFVGPVSWRSGRQDADLRVDAPGWRGGAAVFGIDWPPRLTRDVLPRVVSAMRSQRSIRITEAVTSDPTAPSPPARPVTTDGREFLDSEPYGNSPAVATVEVAVVRRPGRLTTIAFGLPAEGIHVQLEIDASYRIVHETLAAPKHLIRRTFSYPG